MAGLAATAGVSLVAVLAVLLISYPVACWRVLSSPSPASSAPPRGWARGVADAVVRSLARSGPARGALQFTIATLGRLQQHRLTIAIALGLALTVTAPIVLAWISGPTLEPQRAMTVPLLAVGPTLMFLVAAGVRVAISIPSELSARWIFASVPSPALAGRIAARRTIWLAAVAPAAVISVVLAASLWRPLDAAIVGVIVAVTGYTLTDAHLWGFAGVPCARLLAPGSSQLQARWPWYLAGFYVVAVLLPQTIAAAHRGPGVAWVLAALVPLAVIVRRGSDRAARVNAVSDEDENQLLLLDLSVPTPRKASDA
jgi:hypothetical protein